MVIKTDAIDTKIPSTSILVTKTQYGSHKQGHERQIEDVCRNISNTCGLVKKTDCNTKITEIENKIPSVTGLVNTAVLDTKATEIENKIPDITNQAAKASLNAKYRGGGS